MVCCQGQIAIFENFVNQRKTAFIHGSHRQSAIKIAKMQQDCRERLASLEEKKWFFTCFVILSPHDFCIRWLRQWPSKNSKVLQRLLYTTTSQAKQYLRDTEWQSKLDSFNSVSARTVLLFTLNLLCAFSNMYDYSCTPRKKIPLWKWHFSSLPISKKCKTANDNKKFAKLQTPPNDWRWPWILLKFVLVLYYRAKTANDVSVW